MSKASKDVNVPSVRCPGFGALQKGGSTHCFVDCGLSGYCQVPVLEYPGLESTKGHRCESHTNLDVIVNAACWGQDTADIGEVRYDFELLTTDVDMVSMGVTCCTMICIFFC